MYLLKDECFEALFMEHVEAFRGLEHCDTIIFVLICDMLFAEFT